MSRQGPNVASGSSEHAGPAELRARFAAAWRDGARPRIEDFLRAARRPDVPDLFRELLRFELTYLESLGEPTAAATYRSRFPQFAELVQAVFGTPGPPDPERPDDRAANGRSHGDTPPDEATAWSGRADDPARAKTISESGPVPFFIGDGVAPVDVPDRIGDYAIEGVLGQGSYGRVYAARDEYLDCRVAIKVPHRERVSNLAEAQSYLNEARIVRSLDHPNIVPVYYAGSTDEFPFFTVSKLIAGTTLAQRIRAGLPAPVEAAAVVAAVADALHCAHLKGVIHRDVKPSNILLDAGGKPYLADFGLAQREENIPNTRMVVGTIPYLSPEQARGEGHRIDGRSDVFSAGVVLYELLAGQRPFQGDTNAAVIEEIITTDPRPPRQLRDAVPRELERICLKALSKPVAQRYATAKDMADDLVRFLASQRAAAAAPPPPLDGSAPAAAPASSSDAHPLVPVVPKGLRSFDSGDREFFLELLPGPRDRDGLTDTVRFWKDRVEETDAGRTFAVGLMYGASGCGKSSLVKAALLPRLAGHVRAIYAEATATDTEARLLRAVRHAFPALPHEDGLAAALALLRRGRTLDQGHKVVLVVDQFEQWLHAHRGDEDTELARALRHCDGGRVQCLVLVRDDFWMAVTRFFRELEILLVEGGNAAAVDLFGVAHARKVLALFGRAFGALPESPAKVTRAARLFLEQAVAGLAVDGKVMPVRLATFAEMVKASEWTPAALKAAGGTDGVGEAFLDQAFCSPRAPAGRRHHEPAARAVLQALLPETGTDIKGAVRMRADLLAASGYAGRPSDFDDLLRVLDGDLRVVTPTAPDAADDTRPGDGPANGTARPPERQFYQLTHDFLVPALRNWLTRKQAETRQGRAELQLAMLTAAWAAKPDNRHLPAWWEWATIRLFTRPQTWSQPQRCMMRKATRFHTLRLGAVAAVVAGFAWIGIEANLYVQARARVSELLAAEASELPSRIRDLAPYRRWADPVLRQVADSDEAEPKKRRNASLALLPTEPSRIEFLAERLLAGDPDEVDLIRGDLATYHPELTGRYWDVLERRSASPEQRLRAACALAVSEADSPRWKAIAADVVNKLVAEGPAALPGWERQLQPVGSALVGPLVAIVRAANRPDGERNVAATLLADYARDQPELLAELVKSCDVKDAAVLLPALLKHEREAVASMDGELRRTLAPVWNHSPPEATWAAPDAETAKAIAAAAGVLADGCAFCQTMPLVEFVAVANRLRRSGYRPTCVRPYAAADTVRVAAAWVRDGRKWQMTHDASAEDVRTQVAARRRDGFLPLDVSAYVARTAGGPPAVRYAVLWSVPGPGVSEAELHVGEWPGDFEEHCRQLTEAGFLQATQTTLDFGDRPYYSAVWWKPAFAVREPFSGLGESVTWFERNLTPSELLTDVRASPVRQWAVSAVGALTLQIGNPHPFALPGILSAAHASARGADGLDYAASWHSSDDRVSAEVHGLDPARHLERCKALLAAGYRPVSVSAVAIGNGNSVVTASVWHLPVVSDADKEGLSKRQARAAVTLARLGKFESLWRLLKATPDPRVRTYAIHYLRPFGIGPEVLVGRFRAETDVSVRRAILLAAGEYPAETFTGVAGTQLIADLLRAYEQTPDAGEHSALEWLLRRWGHENELNAAETWLAAQKASGSLQWYVNGERHTLVKISRPNEFWMGSPGSEPGREPSNESLTRVCIPYSFAIATKEVTVAQFARFLRENPAIRRTYNWETAASSEEPITRITWCEAVQYCQWLSRKEHFSEDELCYPSAAQLNPDKPPPVPRLDRPGYRLPLEAEWEYAARAGTETARSCGSSEDMLPNYAWYARNSDMSPQPTGRLKPNDYGLFDMYGNAGEWCLDLGPALEHGLRRGPDQDPTDRVWRGGTFSSFRSRLRSAFMTLYKAGAGVQTVGFRIARTCP